MSPFSSPGQARVAITLDTSSRKPPRRHPRDVGYNPPQITLASVKTTPEQRAERLPAKQSADVIEAIKRTEFRKKPAQYSRERILAKGRKNGAFKAKPKNPSKEQMAGWNIDTSLSTNAGRILALLRQAGPLPVRDISARANVTLASTRSALPQLKVRGWVEYLGRKQGWQLTKEAPQ